MSWIADTVSEFGRQLGLPGLGLDERGAMQLQLQSGGVLAVEPAGASAEILVYLGRPLGFDGGRVLRAALELAHQQSALTLPVQVAVRGESPDAMLLMALRIPEREFTLQSLGHAVDYLGRWFDGARRV